MKNVNEKLYFFTMHLNKTDVDEPKVIMSHQHCYEAKLE